MSAEVMVRQQSRSRSIVYCAAAIACMAVTAWVTVPIGPVPLSLSPLAIFFTLFALKPRDAFIAICGYVALGAIGVPWRDRCSLRPNGWLHHGFCGGRVHRFAPQPSAV